MTLATGVSRSSTRRRHQPSPTADRRLAIVFNGEIYNFPPCGRTWALGRRPATRSDTEALLHLYDVHGTGS
jgi:asparagine synthetase B (glutamine-hydrolysing)